MTTATRSRRRRDLVAAFPGDGCYKVTMAKKKPTKADREAAREQMLVNAERTRRLAERAQLELDERKKRDG